MQSTISNYITCEHCDCVKEMDEGQFQIKTYIFADLGFTFKLQTSGNVKTNLSFTHLTIHGRDRCY